jgi:hypothetical protein
MLVSLVRLVHGVAGMLVGRGGLLLCRANTGLSPFINLFDLILRLANLGRVLVGLISHLIYFCLYRSRGVADVLFGSAAASQQGAGQDARGRKESFHSFKNLGCSQAIFAPL